ncbi:MAG: sigma-70 family RNA polymerase sigma factor [Bacteroidota bacterium]
MSESIQHIIETHRDKIFKTCLGYTGNVEQAKDLAQEVCINLWRGLEKFKGEAQIATWVYRITVNTCLMYRRKKRLPTVQIKAIQEAQMDTEMDTSNQQQDLQLLQKFIAQLPEKERIIIILYLENLSYDAIAEVTGLTNNYIGVKINRIKKLLTRKFKEHGRFKNNLE